MSDTTKTLVFADFNLVPDLVRIRANRELSNIKGAIPVCLTMVDTELTEDEASAFNRRFHGKYPIIYFESEWSGTKWGVIVSYET